MAALISKTGVLIINRQTARTTCAAIQICNYSEQPHIIKKPTIASLRRGTGGRSSFNGIVCTVFGNSGFIGQHLVNRLGKIGTQVILPYRKDLYDVFHLKLCGDLGQILFHPFEIRDEESIRKSIKYSNVVINCIGRDWETKNFSYEDVHVDGARRIARIAKEMGVPRLIHISCLKVSPNPQEIYIKGGSRCLKSKWLGEQAVQEEFPEAIIVRLATVYGQSDHFLQLYCSLWRHHLRSIHLWKMGEETEKQPIWVGDVCRGIISIIKNPKISGKTYQFVGPQRYKLSDLVDWINRSIRYNADGFGYERKESTSLLFWLKVYLIENLTRSYPLGGMHYEGLEMEHISDNVIKGIPTLEDLGIDDMTLMESQIPWELRCQRMDGHYIADEGEFPPPRVPKPIPMRFVDANI